MMAARMLLGDASPWSVAGAAAAVALLWFAAWVLEWAWWTARQLGRALRAQGLRGTRYRLFTGDVPEKARLSREARLQPMPRGSHDITPRVQPMFSNVMKEHGKMSFTWFGPTPRVTIPDPELVREILSNKFGHYGKRRSSRFGKLLADGVASHEGDKWAKHRRILNPAFHHEKIKRMLPVFSACCEEMITRWENSMSTEGLSEIDVCPEFQNLTGDVISRTAFGSNYQEGMKIFQLQGELGERLIKAFQTLFYPRLLVEAIEYYRTLHVDVGVMVAVALHHQYQRQSLHRNGLELDQYQCQSLHRNGLEVDQYQVQVALQLQPFLFLPHNSEKRT